MAEYAVLARDCGASIIGGCCGTMPEHISRMRRALETRPRIGRPTLERVAEMLGPFSSPGDGISGPSTERSTRRRRRRDG